MTGRAVARRGGRSHLPPTGEGTQVDAAQPFDGMVAAWLGLPWLNLWAQAWQAWLAPHAQPLEGPAPTAERRQTAGAWLPQFEATVIPFRRRDDVAGTQATRLSMRVHVPGLPWLGSPGNVIMIDTLLPRPHPDAEQD